MVRKTFLAAALVLFSAAVSQAAVIQGPLRYLDPNGKYLIFGSNPTQGVFLAPNCQFIDQTGKAMPPALFRAGMPLTITYTPGDPRIATVVQGYRYIPPTPPTPPRVGPFPK